MEDRRQPIRKRAPASSRRRESCFRRVAANGATARLFEKLWTASKLPQEDSTDFHQKFIRQRCANTIAAPRQTNSSDIHDFAIILQHRAGNVGSSIALLTGRVSRTASGAPGCPYFILPEFAACVFLRELCELRTRRKPNSNHCEHVPLTSLLAHPNMTTPAFPLIHDRPDHLALSNSANARRRRDGRGLRGRGSQ